MMATAPNQIMLGLPNCMKQRPNIGARGATRSAMLTSPEVLACDTDCPQSFRAEFHTFNMVRRLRDAARHEGAENMSPAPRQRSTNYCGRVATPESRQPDQAGREKVPRDRH